MSERFTNALIKESSPYLLQHAHNPVHWKPYNRKTMEQAKKDGKPLIISIGYSACHWCHVMERESFEDEAVAAYMNTYFTCIKVDREERPDVDQIYMSAVQMISGRGGWPLNCFALPDGRPFHGGTYFPKPNWLGLLQTVHHEFTNNLTKLEDYAGQLISGLEAMSDAPIEQPKSNGPKDLLKTMVTSWKPSFDGIFGGVSKAPKFPMPSNYVFLLHYGISEEDEETIHFVDHTLTAMAMGGIHDHVGGGFARYAVDDKWKVPHFEKMLYDNAQLLELFAQAYVLVKNPLYLEVCEGIVTWVEREMTSKSGLIYSALDADSEGKEGLFYTFTKDELKVALSEDEFNFASWVFQLDDSDVWEEDRFILERRWTDSDLADKYQCSENEVRKRRKNLYSKLLGIRKGRVRPGLDNKILCSWNAMYAASLVKAGVILGRTQWTRNGEALFHNLVNVFYQEEDGVGTWYHSKTEDSAVAIPGLLEDAIFMLRAASVVADYNGKNHLSGWIAEQLRQLVSQFYHEESKIFNMVSSYQSDLILKPVEVFDGVIPSVNSVAIEVIAWLEARFGIVDSVPKASVLLSRFMSSAEQYPSAHSHYALQQLRVDAAKDVVITGENAKEYAYSMHQSKLGAFRIFFSTEIVDLPPFQNRFEEGKTGIYVCENRTCELPVYDPEKVVP